MNDLQRNYLHVYRYKEDNTTRILNQIHQNTQRNYISTELDKHPTIQQYKYSPTNTLQPIRNP